MARIPDVSTLGGRRTPSAARPGSNIVALGRSGQDIANISAREAATTGRFETQAAAETGAGAAQLAQSLGRAGQTMQAAQDRIQSRRDAVARARALSSYEQQANERLIQIQSEQDLGDPAVAQEYAEFTRTLMRESLEGHEGSPDSRARLAVALEQRRSRISGQAAGIAFEAQKTQVETLLNGRLNEFSAAARANPSNLNALRGAMRNEVDELAGALSPAEESAYIRAADSILAEAAVESLILGGQADLAEQQLLNQPGLLATLDPNAQKRLFGKIASFRAQQGEGTARGFAARAELRAGLQREPSEAELQRKLGVDPPRSLVTIEGARETAFEKELGKADAERLTEIETTANRAARDLAEIERMNAAIESGRFTTGVFSDARQFLARLATFVGASDDVQQTIGDAATADVLDAASKNLAVEAAQKLGRITNMSLTFIIDSLPALSRTPEGNRILLEVMQRTSQREIEAANLAQRYLDEHGSLRPEGEKSYFQAVRDLDESDPVITDELRQRIIEGSQKAPSSFGELFGETEGAPAGLEIPEGFTFVRMQDGKAVIRDAAGTEYIQE